MVETIKNIAPIILVSFFREQQVYLSAILITTLVKDL